MGGETMMEGFAMDERRRINRKAIFEEMMELTDRDTQAAAVLTAGEMLFEDLHDLTSIIGQGVHIGLFGREADDRDLTVQKMVKRIVAGRSRPTGE